ncbi:MAG: ABC transporter ATP-binding protein [Candidatus Omnitrophota bacterium]
MYRIGEVLGNTSFAERLNNLVLAPFRSVKRAFGGTVKKKSSHADTIWALRDVALSIRRGEVVGIIGLNGSGKTTLLKILSRITEPTEGYARIRGRVGSLLEVGTGFHPELTGRENIYLNGAILCMTRAEMGQKFDQIVSFAEVEKFIDTPVKLYSSGMYVRLAFAVAAHLEPDILLVDEVLAVGDYAFQRKCLGRMSEVAKEGRTVLFVSHNMFTVQNLCTRAILLASGKIVMEGEPTPVINKYMDETKDRAKAVSWDRPEVAPGDERARLKAMRIVSQGVATPDPDIDKDFQVEIDYWMLKPLPKVLVSIHIYTATGVCILTTSNTPSVSAAPDPYSTMPYSAGIYRTSCTIPALFLNEGPHLVHIWININNLPQQYPTDVMVCKKNILAFNVIDTGAMRKEYVGPWLGVVRPRLLWKTEKVEDM